MYRQYPDSYDDDVQPVCLWEQLPFSMIICAYFADLIY